MLTDKWTKHAVNINVDSSEVLYLGKGKKNYGKVMGNDKGFPYMPFYPFPAKVENKNLLIDLEGTTINRNSDLESDVYKYAIPFSERIRAILRKIKEPQKVFELNQTDKITSLDFIKDALESSYRAEEAEYYNHKNPEDKYWTSEKRINDIEFAHKMISIIELQDYEKGNETNIDSAEISKVKQSKRLYNGLILKAISHYNDTHPNSLKIM